MKTLAFALCALSASFLIAADTPTAPMKNPPKKLDKAKLLAAIYKRTGGKIKEPGVQRGKIVYVNCQKAADVSLLKENADYYAKELRLEIEVAEGSFDFANPKVQGEASIFVVDDPKLPISIFAPEARWGVVNVAPLKSDKPQFFTARVKKELSRAFGFLAGAVASQYTGALTAGMTKVEDLDKHPDWHLPLDVMPRFQNYLKGYGIVPYELKTYREACQAGWAPNPTNDVQKRIWDEVHSIPTQPLKLEK